MSKELVTITHEILKREDGDTLLISDVGEEGELDLTLLRLKEDKAILLYNPEFQKEIGAQALVSLLLENGFGGGVLVTPESTKSEGMMERVREILIDKGYRDTELVKLIKEEHVEGKEYGDHSSESYGSIKADDEDKFVLRVKDEDVEKIKNAGGSLWLIDDVESTGETARAMREAVGVDENESIFVVFKEEAVSVDEDGEQVSCWIEDNKLHSVIEIDDEWKVIYAALLPVLWDPKIIDELEAM